MEKDLKIICEDLKVGYEMYQLYCKLNNIGKKNIIVNYSKIDNIDALIKVRNFYKKYNFEEDLEEIEYALKAKLVEYKNYVKYCRSLSPIPLEPKYYSHIKDSINKIKLIM